MTERSGQPASGVSDTVSGVYANDVHANVGSYVVDALDPPERAEFRAHLEDCPSCRHEVTEFAETAAELALLVEATPPPALRSTVLSEIGRVRPLPPASAVRPAPPPPPPADVAPFDDHPSVMPWSLALGTTPVERTEEQPRPTLAVVLMVVAAVLCAVLIFLAGWLVGALGR